MGPALWLEGCTLEKGRLHLSWYFPKFENCAFFFFKEGILSKALPLPAPPPSMEALPGPQLEPPAQLPNSNGAGGMPACPVDFPSTHR